MDPRFGSLEIKTTLLNGTDTSSPKIRLRDNLRLENCEALAFNDTDESIGLGSF